MIKTIYIYLLFCIFPMIGFSQELKSNGVSIPIAQISDSSLYELLKNVLERDSYCSFFSDSLSYSVFIYDTIYHDLPFYYLTFEGNSDITSFFKYPLHHVGCVKYNKHCFFINNKSTLFKKELVLTGKNYFFDEVLIGKYELVEDDSWPIHFYWYFNKDYMFIKTINEEYRCK